MDVSSVDWAMFWVSVVQTILIVLSVGMVFVQVRQATHAMEVETRRRQLEATIQFFSDRWERVYVEKLRLEAVLGPDLFRCPCPAHIIEGIDNSDELRLSVNHILGFMEGVATGVNHGAFDIQMVDKLMGGAIILFYRFFVPYIKHYRSFNGSQRFFDQFEHLAERLCAFEKLPDGAVVMKGGPV